MAALFALEPTIRRQLHEHARSEQNHVVDQLFTLKPPVGRQLLDVSPEPGMARLAERLRDSRLLALAGYLPGGLVVGILDRPEEPGANLARLAGLWFAALACISLEYRVLSRHLLGGLRTASSGGGVHFSLAPILRRSRRLTPEACLFLIEFETLMRLGWYRVMALGLLFSLALLQTGSVYVLLVTVALLSSAFLNVRSQSYGHAHRYLGELFVMPVRLIAPATAYSRALAVLPAVTFVVMICWAWYRTGWPGLATLSLWFALPLCILVGGHGDGVYHSARSPGPFDFTPYAGKLPSSLVWSSVAFNLTVMAAPALLAFLAPRTSWGPAAAVGTATVLVVGAVIFNNRRLRAADRIVRSDPQRILAKVCTSLLS